MRLRRPHRTQHPSSPRLMPPSSSPLSALPASFEHSAGMRTGQTCYPGTDAPAAKGPQEMALFAFGTFGVTTVPPLLPGPGCTPWSQALWGPRGQAVVQPGECQHSEVSAPTASLVSPPAQQDTPLQCSCLTSQHAVCLPAGNNRQRGRRPPCPGAASAGALVSLWPSLHIAELGAGLHSAQGTAACRFPGSTCTRCSSWRRAKHILEMG